MNSSLPTQDDEASLLDTLLVLGQNLWLLILGPLVVASLVLGIQLAWPQRFSSQAILTLPASVGAQAPGIMKSAVVLDSVLSSLSPDFNGSRDSARKALAANIKIVAAKDGLLHIDVTAPTAQEAQKTANFLIDAWLRTTKPRAREQAELEKRLAHAKETLLAAQSILATQKTALSMAGLGELLDRYFAQTLDFERAINGLTRDVVIQAPTLANRPMKSPYIATFLLVSFGAELFFLMWVLGRHALKTAGRNPVTAQKLGRLRASLTLFRRKRNTDHEKSGHTEGAQ